ncbi:type IV secretion system DNA-binding domain-containing protein [Leptothoe sp. EHU-05/26/07-4]
MKTTNPLKWLWVLVPVWQSFITLPLSNWIRVNYFFESWFELLALLLIAFSALLACLAGLVIIYTNQIRKLAHEYEFSSSIIASAFLLSYLIIVFSSIANDGSLNFVFAFLVLGLAIWQTVIAIYCLNSFKIEALQRKIFNYLEPLRERIDNSQSLIKKLKDFEWETEKKLVLLLENQELIKDSVRSYEREEKKNKRVFSRVQSKVHEIHCRERNFVHQESTCLPNILIKRYREHSVYSSKSRAKRFNRNVAQIKVEFLHQIGDLKQAERVTRNTFSEASFKNSQQAASLFHEISYLTQDADILRNDVTQLIESTKEYVSKYENIFHEAPQLVNCSDEQHAIRNLEKSDFLIKSIETLDSELQNAFHTPARAIDSAYNELSQKSSELTWEPELSFQENIQELQKIIQTHESSLEYRLEGYQGSTTKLYQDTVSLPSLEAAGFIMARNLEWFELPIRMLALGSSGAGKSMFLEMALYPIYLEIARQGATLDKGEALQGPPIRVLVFDVDGEVLPLVDHVGISPKQRFFLNPYDDRGDEHGFVGWDAAKDLSSRRAIRRFTEIILADEKNSNSNHFNRLARQALQLVMIALREEKGDEWSFYESLFIATDINALKELLKKNSIHGYRSLNEAVFGRAEHGSDLFSTMISRLNDLMEIAAIWHQRKVKISIRDWLTTSSVLALSRLGDSSDAMNRINQALIQIFADITEKESPNVDHLTTTVVIDEATMLAPLPDVDKLCTYGRKKGVSVYLAFQSIPEALEKFGEGSLKAILGQCDVMALLRTNCPDTAKWMSERCGEYHKEDYLIDITLGESVQDSKTFTTGQNESVTQGTSKNKTHGTTSTETWNTTDTNTVSQAYTSGTTDTSGHTYNQGKSTSIAKGENIGSSETIGESDSTNRNRTKGYGKNWGNAFSEGWRDGEGFLGFGFGNDTRTYSDNHGGSRNWSKSDGRSHTNNRSYSRNQSESTNMTQSTNEGISKSQSHSDNSSQTNTTGYSLSKSVGGSRGVTNSETIGSSESRTSGSSTSDSIGQQQGRSRSVTVRQQRQLHPRVEYTEFLDQHFSTKHAGIGGIIIARDFQTERNSVRRVDLPPNVVSMVKPEKTESLQGFILRDEQETESIVESADTELVQRYLEDYSDIKEGKVSNSTQNRKKDISWVGL